MTAPWPALTWATHTWTHRDPLASHRARLLNTGDFRAAVVPAIQGATPPLPPDVHDAATRATQQMLRFDQAAGGLAAMPFAAVLLRGESATSSQIENLTVRARNLSLAGLGLQTSPNAAMVARNVTALRTAVDAAEHLDRVAILSMHRALMHGIDRDAGSVRTEWVWIGGESPVTASFVAPEHPDVGPALDDLVAFLGRRDLDPTVQAALAHAQFETIHPFTDGNGRCGRALVSALLRARGVTQNLTVPLSSGLLHNLDGYIAALTAYRAGDPIPIVTAFSEAAEASITNARLMADEIEAFRQEAMGSRTRVTPALRAIIDLCCREPAFTAGMLIETAGVTAPTAYRTADALTRAGVLQAENRRAGGQRVWTVPAVLRALDRFAERAGRRASHG